MLVQVKVFNVLYKYTACLVPYNLCATETESTVQKKNKVILKFICNNILRTVLYNFAGGDRLVSTYAVSFFGYVEYVIAKI